MAELMRALFSAFVAAPDGSETFVGTGHLYPDDDPMVVDHPTMFGPADSPTPGPRVFSAADEPVITEPETPADEVDALDEDEQQTTDPDEPGDQIEAKPGTRRARQTKES